MQGQAPGAGEVHTLAPKGTVGSIPIPCYQLSITPSQVTERLCKSCAYAHARFESWVVDHLQRGQKITEVGECATLAAAVRLRVSAPKLTTERQ